MKLALFKWLVKVEEEEAVQEFTQTDYYKRLPQAGLTVIDGRR